MILILGIFGSGERKNRGVYLLTLFTIGGSAILLISIISLGIECGTYNFQDIILNSILKKKSENFYFFCFLIAFSIKVPILPFHT